MKTNIAIILISVIVLTGCNRTVSCSNRYITPAFIGFNLSDLDTLVIREYKKDDNFLTLLDTTLIITDNNTLASRSSNDTTIVPINYISEGEVKYIFPDHDWQIYIPAQNMIVSMSNFANPQKDEKCFLGGDLCPKCSNPIDSFLQNGQQVIPQYGTIKNYGSGYLTYIHR